MYMIIFYCLLLILSQNSHNPNTLDLVFLIAEKEKQDSDSQEIDSRVSSPILKLYGESLP